MICAAPGAMLPFSSAESLPTRPATAGGLSGAVMA
jgi:hypothetical protein